MPSINRRNFIVGAAATGAYLTTQSWSAVSSLAQTATKTFSGNVTIPEGFTVPAGETWEFDPNVSTTVVVEKNVVVYGILRMRPSSASVVHTLRFENVDESKFVGGGMEVRETDVGLWVMGFGRLDLQGTPKPSWNRTGWDPSWLFTDEVRIAPMASGDFGSDGFALYSKGDPVPSIEIPGVRTWSFADIASSIFAEDIEAIAAAGITSGYGDGRFGPDDGVTRAQMAAFLVRALDLGAAGSAGFSDVAGHWAEDEINRLAEAGITSGYGDGRFGPDDGVTRAQMAAFLVRALDLGAAGSAGFSDVAGHWAEDEINRLAAAGITSGYGDGRFGPDDGVTRGQMAAFLNRGLDLRSVASTSSGLEQRAEILNLTRNVRITGTDLGRTHLLIHSAVAQTIRYAELRHVGPRSGGSADSSENVLGRYGVHFHHCGDGSRGSEVLGTVVAQAGNHAFVPHSSHGIRFEDCISYDTVESAYWWDNRDLTHDLTIESSVAAFVRSIPETRGFRLSGFALHAGTGLTLSNSVAVGVQGSKNAAGFLWPEFLGGEPIDAAWSFTGNVAHNNQTNGIFVWQNAQDPTRHAASSTLYRNGKRAIEHGAYTNNYIYRDLVIFDNEVGIMQHALTHPGDPTTNLRFENLAIGGGEAGIILGHHNLESSEPTIYRNCSISSPTAVLVDETGGPGLYDFVDCSLNAGDFKIATMRSGSRIRVQNGGEAFEVKPSGDTVPITPFA